MVLFAWFDVAILMFQTNVWITKSNHCPSLTHVAPRNQVTGVVVCHRHDAMRLLLVTVGSRGDAEPFQATHGIMVRIGSTIVAGKHDATTTWDVPSGKLT
jgi:hypothetical protein